MAVACKIRLPFSAEPCKLWTLARNTFHGVAVQEKQEKQEKVLSCVFSCRKRAHPCFFCFTFKPLANIAHVIFQN